MEDFSPALALTLPEDDAGFNRRIRDLEVVADQISALAAAAQALHAEFLAAR